MQSPLENHSPDSRARPIADPGLLAKRHDWSSSQSPSVIAFKEDPGQLVKSSRRRPHGPHLKGAFWSWGSGSFPAGGGAACVG